MSVTFYVEGWNEQPNKVEKVMSAVLYPSFDKEELVAYLSDDPETKVDDNGELYEERTVYENEFPDFSVNYMTTQMFLRLIGQGDNEDDTGSMTADETKVSFFKVKSLITDNDSVNTKDKLPSYVRGKLEALMNLLYFAAEKDRGVYWA